MSHALSSALAQTNDRRFPAIDSWHANHYSCRYFVEVCVVLFPTLESYYFYQIKLAPLPIASLMLLLALLCSTPGLRVDKRTTLFAVAASVVMFLSCAIALSQTNYDIYANSLFGVAIGPVYFVMFCIYFGARPAGLERALRLTLVLHLSAMIVQLVFYSLTGHYIDFLAPITGEHQRWDGWSWRMGLIRPTGLHSEPSTYSLCMVTLVYMRRRFSSALSWLDYAALASAIANFSFLGLILAGPFIILQLLSRTHIIRKMVWSMLALVFLWATVGARLLHFISTRMDPLSRDHSLSDRYLKSLRGFQELAPVRQMFGIGLGNNELGSQLGTYGSTYGYLAIHLGIVLSVALIGLICWQLRSVYHAGTRTLLFLLILFLGTYQITFVTFWYVLAGVATLEHAMYVAGKMRRSQGFVSVPQPQYSAA